MFLWHLREMDFDPNGIKWQCCCCQLPTGLQALGAAEMVLSTAVAVGTAIHIAGDAQPPTVFEVCLIMLMAAMALTSGLLIYAIQKHKSQFMYPSIFTRGLLIVFIQVFGVSTVVSPHSEPIRPTDWDHRIAPPPATSVALRLVLLVFGMLFLTVLIVYICYLIVRGISYEKAFARRKARRDSLIIAGQIDPDFGSRRASNA